MNQKTVVEAEQAGFHFAQSHQNDPMGARVAYEVIEKIENAELLRHTQVMGEYLRAGYKSMQKDFPIIREIRGIGLLNSIELDASVSEEAMREIDRQFFEHGIIAGVKPKKKSFAPIVHSS
jgi:4-aminobutyrate aminotransferase-like enzyme